MNILIKQAKVIDPGSVYHNEVIDVLIEGGLIKTIKRNINNSGSAKVIEANGLHISAGWIDMQAVSGDPGFEHKENLESLVSAAAAGGYTGICLHSCNAPALDGKSQIEYVINKTDHKLVNIFPLGTITVNAGGQDLAEMFDMKQSGAVAFSDHKHPIKDAGMILRAIQYSSNINSLIITHCNDQSISYGGQMNEGEAAAGIGLKGIPALAEELMIQRNLAILEYTGGRLHIPTISTRGAVELIKKAKANGLKVSAGVAAVNLCLDDTVLKDFDSNYKVDPPLRSKKDVQALCNGLIAGTIDVIVSDHFPQDSESKELEFDLADNGIINLQTAFSCAIEGLKHKNIDTIIKAMTENPRALLGLRQVKVAEKETANLTLFNPDLETTFTQTYNRSRSKNSPFFGQMMKGKVFGVIHGTQSFFN
jgi:dihydroorotase